MDLFARVTQECADELAARSIPFGRICQPDEAAASWL